MSQKINTRTLTMAATCVVLAVVLDQVKLFSMPEGGSVAAGSMFFVALSAYWFGPWMGMLTGVVTGLLDLLLGGYVVHPAQMLLDYPLAFAALGLAGFFRKTPEGLDIGYVVGALGNFFMHFLAGVIFFAEYAGDQNAVIYSAGYNISYIWPEILFTLILINVPAFRKAIDRVKPATS